MIVIVSWDVTIAVDDVDSAECHELSALNVMMGDLQFYTSSDWQPVETAPHIVDMTKS